jgi:hypothetical protein
MKAQLDFFAHIIPVLDENGEQVKVWQSIGNWCGPVSGQYCQFESVFARDRLDNGHYVYMEPVEILAVDGYKVTVRAAGIVPQPPDFRAERRQRKSLTEEILTGGISETTWIPNPHAGTIFEVEFKDLWPWRAYEQGHDCHVSPDGKQMVTVSKIVSDGTPE